MLAIKDNYHIFRIRVLFIEFETNYCSAYKDFFPPFFSVFRKGDLAIC